MLWEGGFNYSEWVCFPLLSSRVYKQLHSSTKGFLSGRSGICLTLVLRRVTKRLWVVGLCGLLAKQRPERLVYGGWRKAFWKSYVVIIESSKTGRKLPDLGAP